MILTELVNLVVADRDLQIGIKVAPVSGDTNHEDVGEEDIAVGGAAALLMY